MGTLTQELKRTLRGLLRTPGFTLAVVLTLAIGIGLNTAIFSFFKSILLKPLPFKDPNRLVFVYDDLQTEGNVTPFVLNPHSFETYREQSETLEIAGHFRSGFVVMEGDPVTVNGILASTNFFSVVGVEPMLGRLPTAAEGEPGADRVVVISYSLWQRIFAGDRDIVGKSVLLSDQNPNRQTPPVATEYTVIGVMPEEFKFAADFRRPNYFDELWVPLILKEDIPNPAARVLGAFGRIRSGHTLKQARAEMKTIVERIEWVGPEAGASIGSVLIPVPERILGKTRPFLIVLFSATSFLLLIACVNVANLLLARSMKRGKEMSLRAALGAGRWPLARQVLGESLILAFLGGLLGTLAAYWSIKIMLEMIPYNVPRLETVSLDTPVLIYTMTVAIVTGLVFALVPAIRASRPVLQDALGEGRAGMSVARRRLMSSLVVTQVALTLLLLVGAGLTLKSFRNLLGVDLGFDPENRLIFALSLPLSDYPHDDQKVSFIYDVTNRLAGLPGVRSCGATTVFPLTGRVINTMEIEGRPSLDGQPFRARRADITPGYHTSMGIPLKKGRLLEESDNKDTRQVVLINEAMEKRFWPDGDALGKRFRVAVPGTPWREIVGVVGDTDLDSYGQSDRPPHFWITLAQSPWHNFVVILHTESDPMALADAVREEVAKVDKDRPVIALQTLKSFTGRSLLRPRFSLILLGIFAAVALLLAAIGVFSIMALSVARMTREFGIRIAVGARQGDILRQVLTGTLKVTAVGIVIGLLASLAMKQVMSSQLTLFNVTVSDPLTFVLGSLFLAVVAFLAGLVPALRASRVDPVTALRIE